MLPLCRYCLWILGNGTTLKNSGSVWKKIVADAKNRGFFHHADEDRNLSVAIIAALVDVDQLDIRLHVEPLLFSGARWKVCYFAIIITNFMVVQFLNLFMEHHFLGVQ